MNHVLFVGMFLASFSNSSNHRMLLSLSTSSVQCPLLSLCFCTNAIRNGKRRPKHTHTTHTNRLVFSGQRRQEMIVRFIVLTENGFFKNKCLGKRQMRELGAREIFFRCCSAYASRVTSHTTFWWINEFNASTGSHLAFSHFLFSSKQQDELREFQFIRSQLTHSPSRACTCVPL